MDDALIRPDSDQIPDAKLVHEEVDAVEYMAGPGRFALGSMSDLVKKFFSHVGDIPGVVAGQSYTKAEMASFLGLAGTDYGIYVQQYSYDDGQDDYGERIYIWNSTAFKISDDAVFVVDADGTRHIENFAVVPRYDSSEDDESRKENFDFETGDGATAIANLYLEQKVDTFGIGRTVIFNFINSDNIPRTSYDWSDYQADLAKESAWYKGPLPLIFDQVLSAVQAVSEQLWNEGVTRFLDGGKPIIYGTLGDDELTASVNAFSPLHDYVSNGVVLVAGSGNDDLNGGDNNDRLYGGDDNDILNGHGGNDTLEGGKGDDILVGGAGFDTYVHRSGDGSDRIVETREADGTFHGLIRIESTVSDQLATGYFKPVDDQPDTYTSADDLTLIRGATWQLQTPDGASIDLGADFQSGDLGIRLGAAPPTTHTQLTGGETGNYLSSTSIGSVRVDGLDGKDMIWGSAEADVLNGGDGNDWIVGYGGADHVDGGPGDDLITGVGDGSFVDAGGGDDIISAVGAEYMVIDRPNSPITADAFWTDVSQHWNSGHSALYLHASGSVTVDYYGGIRPGETYRGESVLGGGWTYEFTITSSDVFNVKYMHPTLAPTGIAPARYAEHGIADMPAHVQGVALWGGDGDDLLIGHGAKDDLVGGKDNDILLGNGGDDDLKGGEGEDILVGGAGIDVLDGGSENDQLFGEAGGDVIFGGGGNDDIWAGPLSALAGADGDDYVDGGAGDDYVESGEGNDTLLGGADNDTLFAGAGSDVLAGGTGVDYLDGGAEQDVLHADDGADVLVGGIGDDTLEGGAGRDTYVYNLGDGIDRIDDYAEPGANGLPIGNILSFGAGIGPADLRLGLGSLAIHLPDGGAIHIEGFNADDPGANPVIDTFEFADGTTLSYHQLIERGFDMIGTVQYAQLQGKADKRLRHWFAISSL